MSKRLQIRMDVELFKEIEEYKLKNNFSDEQEVVREILREKFIENKSFLSKFKKLFNF